MCYRVSNKATKKALQERYGAGFTDPENYTPYYHVAAFVHPQLAVLTTAAPESLDLFTWGFIPPWEKSVENATQRMLNTANARGEELSTKASFRDAWAQGQRCIIPVTGFFESHTLTGGTGKPESIPYYIHLKSDEIFSLGGIYNTWTDQSTGEIHKTFSILTVEANPLMKLVHTKGRMPLILTRDTEKLWLDSGVSAAAANELILPYPEGGLEAYAVYKDIHNPKMNSNLPEALDPFNYTQHSGLLPEL